MACLTEEMKNRRDRKRKASLLIVDSDLGNMGLYKSILSMEYDLDNVFSIEDALKKLEENTYDGIIVDDAFDNEGLVAFVKAINNKDREQLICLITEKANSDLAIRCVCRGVNRIIEKPFTRDGLSNGIYEELKSKRDNLIKKHILIFDEDLNNLSSMKKKLKDTYNVTILNCKRSSFKYIKNYRPDLVIADATLADMSDEENKELCEEFKNERQGKGISLLFMTANPNEKCVLSCAQYGNDGFFVKPIDMDHLLEDIDHMFLVDAYGVRG